VLFDFLNDGVPKSAFDLGNKAGPHPFEGVVWAQLFDLGQDVVADGFLVYQHIIDNGLLRFVVSWLKGCRVASVCVACVLSGA
jgi:hypothetical protein